LIWIKNWLTLFVRLSICVAAHEALVRKMRLVERTFSIRTVMLTLVCGGVAVMLGAALAAGWLSYREYRDRIGSSLIAASQAVMVSVDNELDEPLAFVSGLSSSSSFAKGDFNNFQERAREVLSPRGYFVIIKSANGGQEYVNTSKPPAAGSTAASPSAVGLLRLGKAGNSHLGRVEDHWMELIDVPIEDESGRRLYTMVIGVPNRIFQDMLAEQHLPRTWRAAILDADWMIVARTLSPEKFVGQKGAGEEFRNAPSDRTHEVRLREGIQAMVARSPSSRRALVRSNWGGVDFGQLVRTELEAFSKRATIAGPSIVLPPQMAQNFTLVLHELATNSAKHGALSSTGGKIAVSWTVERSHSSFVLKFKWQESEGPPVAAPTQHGFGTQLIKAVFSEVRLEYPIDGLRCEIDVPLTSPVPSQAALAEDDAVVSSG